MNKTNKILVIVESPHKAKVITKILKDAGYTNARVIASVGHILTLADGNRKAFNSGIYPEDNFRMNLKIAEDKYKVVEEIKTQVKWAEKVYVAADDFYLETLVIIDKSTLVAFSFASSLLSLSLKHTTCLIIITPYQS